MKDAQKKLILWALLVFAILFHVLFCEWQIFDWKHGDNEGAMIAHLWSGGYHSDIWLYAHGESTLLAVSLGIVVPLLLVTVRIYLQLGWFNTIFIASRLKKWSRHPNLEAAGRPRTPE